MAAKGRDYLRLIHTRDERAPDTALEVIVLWGDDVLHVAHAAPARPFAVGEREADFAIGEETLGCERLPITTQDGDDIALVIPEGARVELAWGGERLTRAELAQAGRLSPCPAVAGAVQCALPVGASARLDCGAFAFLVTLSRPAPRIAVGSSALALDRKALRWTASSFGVHLLALLLFYLAPPTSSALSLNEHDAQHRLAKYLVTATVQPDPPDSPSELGPSGGGGAEPAAGDSGAAGTPDAPDTKRRLAIRRTSDTPAVAPAREDLVRLATTGGLIAELNRAASLNTQSAVFQAMTASGHDAETALGALIGDRIGASRGAFGTGPIGTGRGAGGSAQGTIGTGGLSTIGGPGGGDGIGGYGRGGGVLKARSGAVPPGIRPLKPEIRGALSKEVIRRIVREHLNEVRYCYEQALLGRPDLQGRVAVRFIVAPDGAVRAAMREQSDVGDAQVERCIVDAVKRWTFPAPDGGGLVVVTYPFALQRAGD